MSKRLLRTLIFTFLVLYMLPAILIMHSRETDEIKPVRNIDNGKYYNTIQEAINDPETKDNHTIFVGAGAYLENVIINKSISLVGENPETTILDGNGTCPIVKVVANQVTMKNFTVKNSGPGPYGAIHLLGSNSGLLAHNIIENCFMGIMLFQSHKNEISSNTISNTSQGIYLDGSANNLISSNSVLESISGIRIGALAVNNTVEKNQIENCTNGIELGSQANYNIFVSNYVNKNTNGVYFQGPTSKNCTFVGNVFVQNDISIEILFPWAVNNSFAYNSFFFNNVNAHSETEPSYNILDYGYPLGGNFWSDYSGADDFQGPYQNQTGSDGIGDTPYHIDSNFNDAYPLMGTLVRVTNVTVKDTIGIIGYSTNSTISDFNFDNQQMLLTITTTDGENTSGFCRAAISKDFINKSLQSLTVSVNGQNTPFNVTESSTDVVLYFTYAHSVASEPSPIPNIYIVAVIVVFIAFFYTVFRIRKIGKIGESTRPEKDDVEQRPLDRGLPTIFYSPFNMNA